jgi:hypothetical protein
MILTAAARYPKPAAADVIGGIFVLLGQYLSKKGLPSVLGAGVKYAYLIRVIGLTKGLLGLETFFLTLPFLPLAVGFEVGLAALGLTVAAFLSLGLGGILVNNYY